MGIFNLFDFVQILYKYKSIMMTENQLYILACIILLTGFSLAKYGWVKSQELYKYGFLMGNSKYKRSQWESEKDTVTMHIRFYYILIFLGISLIVFSLFLVFKIDLYAIH